MQCFAVATRGSLLSLQRGFLSSSACCPVRLPRFISNLQPAKFLGDGDPLQLYSAAMATTESMFPNRSDFDYDYETLRTTGVVLAAIMFVSGILIALIPAHLVPKSQRQRCLLKLYRKYSIDLKGRTSLQEPRQRIHTYYYYLWPYLCQRDDQQGFPTHPNLVLLSLPWNSVESLTISDQISIYRLFINMRVLGIKEEKKILPTMKLERVLLIKQMQ